MFSVPGPAAGCAGLGKPASAAGWEPSRSGRSPTSAPPAATSATSRAARGRCNVTGGRFRPFPTSREGCRCRWVCREEGTGSLSHREPCSGTAHRAGQDGSSPAAPSCPPWPAAPRRSVPPAHSARQLPARFPACCSPRRGALHLFTPTRVLRSLTARAPVERHQKLISDKLILVQSCRRSFCCSACHNLSCLVRPHNLPPTPSCPTSPTARSLTSIPTERPCGCKSPLGPSAAPGEEQGGD